MCVATREMAPRSCVAIATRAPGRPAIGRAPEDRRRAGGRDARSARRAAGIRARPRGSGQSPRAGARRRTGGPRSAPQMLRPQTAIAASIARRSRRARGWSRRDADGGPSRPSPSTREREIAARLLRQEGDAPRDRAPRHAPEVDAVEASPSGCGRQSPARTRSSVLFPLPFGPTTAVSVPVRLPPWRRVRMRRPPRSTVTWRASSWPSFVRLVEAAAAAGPGRTGRRTAR